MSVKLLLDAGSTRTVTKLSMMHIAKFRILARLNRRSDKYIYSITVTGDDWSEQFDEILDDLPVSPPTALSFSRVEQKDLQAGTSAIPI